MIGRLTFRIHVPGVKGNSIFFCYSGIEGALHVVNGIRDEIEAKKFIGVKVVKQTYGFVSQFEV